MSFLNPKHATSPRQSLDTLSMGNILNNRKVANNAVLAATTKRAPGLGLRNG